MAKTSLKIRQARRQKFKVREYTRCERCGRPQILQRVYARVLNFAGLACLFFNDVFAIILSSVIQQKAYP